MKTFRPAVLIIVAVALVLMTSHHVTEAKAVQEDKQKQKSSGFYDWGLSVFNDVKDTFGDIFGRGEETTSSPGKLTATTDETIKEHITTTTTTVVTSSATSLAPRLTEAECKEALTQCGFADVISNEEELRVRWKQEAKKEVQREVRKTHAHYRLVLKHIKKIVNSLINVAITDPSMTSLPDLCDLLDLPENDDDVMVGDEATPDEFGVIGHEEEVINEVTRTPRRDETPFPEATKPLKEATTQFSTSLGSNTMKSTASNQGSTASTPDASDNESTTQFSSSTTTTSTTQSTKTTPMLTSAPKTKPTPEEASSSAKAPNSTQASITSENPHTTTTTTSALKTTNGPAVSNATDKTATEQNTATDEASDASTATPAHPTTPTPSTTTTTTQTSTPETRTPTTFHPTTTTRKAPPTAQPATSTVEVDPATETSTSTTSEPTTTTASTTTTEAPPTAQPATSTTTEAPPTTTTTKVPPTSQPATSTTTEAPPTTTLAPRCTCSAWSEWSAPLGFGTQERTRVILVPGRVCPEAQFLVEYRQIPTSTSTSSPNGDNENIGSNPSDDVQVVSENFHNDFIRASEGKPRDLLLILDSSGSISDKSFEAMKAGVELLIDTLCDGFGPSPAQNRLSIVQFSSSTVGQLSFNPDHQDPDLLKLIVGQLRPMYGHTCTGDALKMAYQAFDEKYGARNYSVHDTLIITDGQSNCGADILSSSRTLQQRSNVYALAIGLSSDPAARGEITSLVSNRDPRHLFSLANFQDFKDMVAEVKHRQEETLCTPIAIDEKL